MNIKMVKYVLKRLLLAVATIFIVITFTFWFMQLIPGGPFTSEKSVDEATMAAMKAKYGLDKPLFEQYVIYLGRCFSFDFGLSLKQKGRTVNEILQSGLRYSIPLGLIAGCMAIVFGTLLGSIAAKRKGTVLDRIIMVLTTASVAFPTFIIATLFLYLFTEKMKLFPTDYVNGGTAAFVLPVITLSLYPTAYITRLTRSATLDSLSADYIITARAKGCSNTRVLFKHVLKNSVAPTITYAGPMFASIITGSLVIEQLYQVPGIGSAFVNSITNRDYSLVMGTTTILTFLIIIMTLISDLLYKVVNPRIKLE